MSKREKESFEEWFLRRSTCRLCNVEESEETLRTTNDTKVPACGYVDHHIVILNHDHERLMQCCLHEADIMYFSMLSTKVEELPTKKGNRHIKGRIILP